MLLIILHFDVHTVLSRNGGIIIMVTPKSVIDNDVLIILPVKCKQSWWCVCRYNNVLPRKIVPRLCDWFVRAGELPLRMQVLTTIPLTGHYILPPNSRHTSATVLSRPHAPFPLFKSYPSGSRCPSSFRVWLWLSFVRTPHYNHFGSPRPFVLSNVIRLTIGDI